MESKSPTAFHDEYIMGRTSEEYQRLRKQAQAFEPATRRVLQQIGLCEGMRCLDVGCGPGEVMRLMGEFVGPSGTVTALDCDSRLGNTAVEVLRATQQSRFQFIECDLESVDEIEGQPFDVTYAALCSSTSVTSSPPSGRYTRGPNRAGTSLSRISTCGR